MKFNIAYNSDKYQYTMGKSFYDTGRKEEIAVFNLFYRKAPENNNWAVVSGTREVVEMALALGTESPEFYEKFLPGAEYAEFRGIRGGHVDVALRGDHGRSSGRSSRPRSSRRRCSRSSTTRWRWRPRPRACAGRRTTP